MEYRNGLSTAIKLQVELMLYNTPIVQTSKSITSVYITIGLLKVTNNIVMLQ